MPLPDRMLILNQNVAKNLNFFLTFNRAPELTDPLWFPANLTQQVAEILNFFLTVDRVDKLPDPLWIPVNHNPTVVKILNLFLFDSKDNE